MGPQGLKLARGLVRFNPAAGLFDNASGMKRLSIPIFIILSFLIVSPAFATSGACSYHSGVNCTLGPATNGDAICNDGTDSATSYYLTQECQVNICAPQFASTTYQAYVTSNASWRSSLNTIISSLISSLQSVVASDQDSEKVAVAALTQSYNEAIQQIQQDEDAAEAESCVSGCLGGNASAAQSVQSTYQGYIAEATASYNAAVAQAEAGDNASVVQACINLWTSTQTKMTTAESYCTNTYGPNSAPLPSNLLSCACGSGDTLQNGECVSYLNACQDIYGQSAFANNDGSCACPIGFNPDATNHTCDYVGQTATPSTPAPVAMLTPAPASVSVAPVSQPIRNTTASIAVKPERTIEPANNTAFRVPTTTAASSVPPVISDNAQSRASVWQTIGGWLLKLNPFSWFTH
jgi:hypothetical protein